MARNVISYAFSMSFTDRAWDMSCEAAQWLLPVGDGHKRQLASYLFLPKLLNDCFVGSRLTAMGTDPPFGRCL